MGRAGIRSSASRRLRVLRRSRKRRPKIVFASRRRYRWLAWVVGLLVLGAVAWLFDRAVSRNAHPPLDPRDLAQVEVGRGIYGNACASCHGPSLEGQPNWRALLESGRSAAPPLNGSGPSWRRPDGDLFAIVKKGPAAYSAGYQADMPAFAQQLSDEEIAATLAYIKSTWPPDLQARQTRRSLEFWTREVH
jgi:mono/diheme cytochrome c family protein